MPTLSIPNIFANRIAPGVSPADADKVNANFNAIATLLNGQLDDDNIASIVEASISFDDGNGHAHGGGSDGKPLELAEAAITFNADGHDHSGGSAGAVAAIAVENGAQGTVKVMSGIAENVSNNPASSASVSLGFATAVIAIDVYWENAGTLTNLYTGLIQDDDGDETGYYIDNISNAGFNIFNVLPDGESHDFYWFAIGV